MNWEELLSQIESCERCQLCRQIRRKVPGQGDRTAPVALVGEGPGQTEDEEGLAFVGAAGQLLTRMLSAIGLPRDRVYICNVVKCRPPNNRVPLPEEQEACAPWLQEQLRLVSPRVVVLLGSTAAKALIDPEFRITREHGQWFRHRGVYYLPTYHPSALLRDEAKKAEAWQDLLSLRDRLIELKLYPDLYPEAGEVQP